MEFKGKTKRLKDAIRQKYAWPGGYAIVLITHDGAILCCECARDNYKQINHSVRHNLKDGWNIIGIDNASNMGNTHTEYCDHCNKTVDEF